MSALQRRVTSAGVLLVVGLVLWGYVAGPLISTIRESMSGPGGPFADYARFFNFHQGAQGEAIVGSLSISLLSVLTSGVIGTSLAVLFNRWDFPLRRLCQVLV